MQRTIRTILTQDQIMLETTLKLDTGTSRIEVQCLLQKVLGVARAYLFAHPERVLSETETASYQVLYLRRLNGEPLAYIFGEREFFGLNFKVTPNTLIPRPDTELLVELALSRIPSAITALRPPPKGEGWGEGNFCVLDLGTGSGAIALAIAHQCTNAQVWACDTSSPALTVARENAQHLGITNAQFVKSDWFTAFSGQRFDIIVANPPYIAADDHHLTQGDVRFEPISALASGTDGLDDIRRIIAQAGTHLRNEGWLLLEHGYNQAVQVRELLLNSEFTSVFSAKDLSGIERCSGGQSL
jgi:release factor glutamine methyltransferase